LLERFHLQGIDKANLTPEQWRAVFDFACHNFGNLFSGATLALQIARDGSLDPVQMDKAQRSIRSDYREIVETMRALMEKNANGGEVVSEKEIQDAVGKLGTGNEADWNGADAPREARATA